MLSDKHVGYYGMNRKVAAKRADSRRRRGKHGRWLSQCPTNASGKGGKR